MWLKCIISIEIVNYAVLFTRIKNNAVCLFVNHAVVKSLPCFYSAVTITTSTLWLDDLGVHGLTKPWVANFLLQPRQCLGCKVVPHLSLNPGIEVVLQSENRLLSQLMA